MPELSSLLRQRLQAGEAPRQQHPDADTLTAYVEQLLPAAESKLVLEHIAVCGDCREIVFLATPEDAVVAGPEAAVPEAVSPSPARRRWFLTPGFGLAASLAAMAVALTLVIELPHKSQPFVPSPAAVVTDQVSKVEAPKVPEANPAATRTSAGSPVATGTSATSPATAPASAPLNNANLDAPRASAAAPSALALNIPAKKSRSSGRERDTRQPLSPEIRAQVAAAQGDVIGGLTGGASPAPGNSANGKMGQVTPPVLEAKAARQDYLNAQRFSKDGSDSANALAGQANLPSAPAPALNATGPAYSGPSTLLSGSFQQSNNTYLAIPDSQQKTTQGTLAFTPPPPEHQSLLSKIVEVGKRPIKRAEPSLQAQNVSRFAMFNNGLSVQHSDAVPASSTAEATDSPSLAKSPAFTARGFGSSRKAFLGGASIYRWKVAQGKLLRSADAVIWLPGYADNEGIEFSTVHSSGLEIWAGGNRGQLVHSTDGGLTWEKTSLGDGVAGNVISIENSGLNIHVVTAPSQGWSSTDGGKTWNKLPQ